MCFIHFVCLSLIKVSDDDLHYFVSDIISVHQLQARYIIDLSTIYLVRFSREPYFKDTNRCLSLLEKEAYKTFVSSDGKLIKHLMIWNKRNRTHLMVLGTSQYPSIYNFVPYLFSCGSNLITTNVCPSVSFSIIKW